MSGDNTKEVSGGRRDHRRFWTIVLRDLLTFALEYVLYKYHSSSPWGMQSVKYVSKFVYWALKGLSKGKIPIPASSLYIRFLSSPPPPLALGKFSPILPNHQYDKYDKYTQKK